MLLLEAQGSIAHFPHVCLHPDLRHPEGLQGWGMSPGMELLHPSEPQFPLLEIYMASCLPPLLSILNKIKQNMGGAG